MSTSQTLLRLGVFTLLALPVVQGQTANSTPHPDANKTADAGAKKAAAAAAKKAAADKVAADKKAAEEAAAKKAADKKSTDAAASGTPPPAAASSTGPWHVTVEAAASDQLSLDVLSLNDDPIPGTACKTKDLVCKRLHLVLTDTVVKDQLKQLHKGDHIQVVYSTDTAKNQNVLKAISVDSVPGSARISAMLGSAVICLFLYGIFSGFKPQQTIIGEDNRYSNSRFQMALWFFVLITTYGAMLWLRVWAAGWDFAGGVDIPKNLLLLSGMSALTFGGAKGITASKAAVGQKTRALKPNFFLDLTHNDGTPAVAAQPAVPAQPAVGNQPAIPAQAAVAAQPAGLPQFDFGDFQMLIITVIAVATYVVLIYNFLGTVEYSKIVSLPDVDTTLLATFGLGQGAYLTKKAVGNVGTS
jgi:hypothetical protein